jgi:hypothetical protein
VVPGRRAGSDAMLRLHTHADGLDMTVAPDGTVTFRRDALSDEPQSDDRSSRVRRAADGAVRRLHRQLGAWSAGLDGLKNGVR